MEINEIRMQGLNIRELDIPPVINVFNNSSQALPVSPPVVVDIGVPIVDIPGCVEAHESNNGSKTLPDDDKEGLVTYCDAGVPSFNPVNYEPNQMVFTGPPEVKEGVKVEPEIPETPETPVPKKEVVTVNCPTPAQEAKEPVGTFIKGFREKVTGYELVGNECIQLTEVVSLPQQIVAGLPSGGQVMQVGGIAVVATTSALLAKPLADLLLKAVKPAVKKVMKKVAAIRGKKPPVLSSGERRAEQRQMNTAVKALRSVFPRRKKRKG
jgi:hypothetical protein